MGPAVNDSIDPLIRFSSTENNWEVKLVKSWPKVNPHFYRNPKFFARLTLSTCWSTVKSDCHRGTSLDFVFSKTPLSEMRMQQKLLQAIFSSVTLNHRACKFNEVVSKLLYSVIILQVHDSCCELRVFLDYVKIDSKRLSRTQMFNFLKRVMFQICIINSVSHTILLCTFQV